MSIDLLIGSDYYWSIFGSERLTLPSGLFLLSSRLGYLLTGPTGVSTSDSSTCVEVTTLLINRLPAQLSTLVIEPDSSSLVEKLWLLEVLGIQDSPVISDDDQALSTFNSTVQFVDGRYQVCLPWKSPNPRLPTNYGLALGRLQSLAKRLSSDHDLLLQYNSVIQQQLQDGVVEPCTSNMDGVLHHYLPHQPLVKPGRVTTKVRVVYDASAKVRRGANSLNDCLNREPVLLPDLVGMLLRFRVHEVVMAADVEKAFLQISISPSDRDVPRFLWFNDITQPLHDTKNLKMLRFCRVPFGLISSPFLLAATVHYHLSQAGTQNALRLLKNIYVDNVVVGCQGVSDAIQLFQDGKQLFADAKMNLRQWVTNSAEVLKALPKDQIGDIKSCKMLGLQWNSQEDVLFLSQPAAIVADQPTKRSVL